MGTRSYMDILNWPHTSINSYLGPTWQIVILWCLLFGLMRLGKIGIVFRLYNTFFHELGHAIFSLLTSGQVVKVELFSNAGGVAVTTHKTWFSKCIVSLAGYPFASAVSWFLLCYASTFQLHYFIYGLLMVYGITLLLWVRNKYGIAWLLLNIALLLAGIYFEQLHWAQWYLFLTGSLIMLEGLWSCLILTYISAEEPSNAGDAQNLRELTYLPPILWALLFTATSVYLCNLTLGGVLGIRFF